MKKHFQFIANIDVPKAQVQEMRYPKSLVFLEAFIDEKLLRKVYIKMNYSENKLSFPIKNPIRMSSFDFSDIDYSKLQLVDQSQFVIVIRPNDIANSISNALESTQVKQEELLYDVDDFVNGILQEILKQ